jgi:hypothetical protein
MSLAIGSVTVALTATPVPLPGNSPGSLVLTNTGANPITLGGSGVTAGAVGPGSATIPAGAVVPLAEVGEIPSGGLFAITVTATGVLNWFYGTADN